MRLCIVPWTEAATPHSRSIANDHRYVTNQTQSPDFIKTFRVRWSPSHARCQAGFRDKIFVTDLQNAQLCGAMRHSRPVSPGLEAGPDRLLGSTSQVSWDALECSSGFQPVSATEIAYVHPYCVGRETKPVPHGSPAHSKLLAASTLARLGAFDSR
jgi:hypothetical protein